MGVASDGQEVSMALCFDWPLAVFASLPTTRRERVPELGFSLWAFTTHTHLWFANLLDFVANSFTIGHIW